MRWPSSVCVCVRTGNRFGVVWQRKSKKEKRSKCAYREFTQSDASRSHGNYSDIGRVFREWIRPVESSCAQTEECAIFHRFFRTHQQREKGRKDAEVVP